jgi:hypothetical protein
MDLLCGYVSINTLLPGARSTASLISSSLGIIGMKSKSPMLDGLSFSFANLMPSRLVLFLVFFRYDDANAPDEELIDDQPKWQTAVMVASLCIFHGLIIAVLSMIFALAMPSYLNFWANLLGIMAAALAAVQYIPQIWTTYHLKHIGSLSIPMMCIQTPGGFLFAGSLFVRLGWEGWSTWGIFILTALMQGCLLSMAIYYELKKLNSPPPSPALRPEGLNRPEPIRTYSEGWEQGLPGPYTAHPERYADTPEELERLQEREDRQVAIETRPLLKPGGIGDPNRNYNTNRRR